MDVFELLRSAHSPVVLTPPDIQKGRSGVGSRSWSRNARWYFWLLLNRLSFRLPF